MLKRAFDFTVAVVALALALPLLLLIALAVRLDSPGPVLFRQVRVGRAERPFEILKFRTMRSELPGGGAAGAEITVGRDARITRVGSWLRASKLDELPQLWNVLAGQMSLVGPRPEVPRYVEHYPMEARREIFTVRPGLTDEASLEFIDEAAMLGQAADPERAYIETILPRKVAAYRRYVREHSLGGDFVLLARTAWRILSPGRR